MKKKPWFPNLSLKKKMLVILALVGLVPLSITFQVSYTEIRSSTLQSQNYAANQNYEQTLSALSGKFKRIEKLSTMVIVNDALVSTLGSDPVSKDIGEQLIDFEKIATYTKVLEESSESENIIYYIDDRFVVSGSDTRFRKLKYIDGRKWAEAIIANHGAPTWVMSDDESVYGSKQTLTLGRILWNMKNYSDSMGIVAIKLDMKQISQSLTKTVPEQVVYLINENGEVIASSDDLLQNFTTNPSQQLPKLKETGWGFEEATLSNGENMFRSNQIGKTGIYLTSIIPKSAATKAANKVGTQMITIYLIVGASLLILIFPVTKSITARVFLLTRKMDQVRNGELRKLDIEPRDDEVGRLVSSYNYMINSVQELLEEQFRLGQEKKGAELKALQSQINPHFLYNTLDMLNWMSQRDEKANIQQVIYALSDYYKLILNKGEDLVTLRDELRLVKIYVEIQQKRFKGRITFEVDVEENIMDCLLPKITLQPLVENAILHGISEKPEGKGTVAIKGRLHNQRIQLTIADDGVGFKNKGHRHPDYHGSGYGVKNIEKRLELYFGESNCLRFEVNQGAGTCVVIQVPAVYSSCKSPKQ
ncbi:cache domain-containing sensor histidine kinase [Paenibacillus sedimenti]|uniref:histidine kinase n=1 Tax=Paenibacillus sedimenti TaxID=2770274 RepID=A0A926KQY4_9BACL|nr:sensor histidine kinase [Paenibacillus sedimenti]MBD0381862.1 sensor histidine kinase [Paenibacillus sedimenti]